MSDAAREDPELGASEAEPPPESVAEAQPVAEPPPESVAEATESVAEATESVAESTAVAETELPTEAAAETPVAVAAAAETPVAVAADAETPVAVAAETPVEPAVPPRRRRIATRARRLLPIGATLLLFGVGIVGGVLAAARQAPDPVRSPATIVLPPGLAGTPRPAVVDGLIDALAKGDSRSVASFLEDEPRNALMNSLADMQLEGISASQTVGDEEHTATALQFIGTTTTGQRVAVDLIVVTSGAKVVTFR